MWRYYCLQLRVCHCALCILCPCHFKARHGNFGSKYLVICTSWQLFIPSPNRSVWKYRVYRIHNGNVLIGKWWSTSDVITSSYIIHSIPIITSFIYLLLLSMIKMDLGVPTAAPTAGQTWPSICCSSSLRRSGSPCRRRRTKPFEQQNLDSHN